MAKVNRVKQREEEAQSSAVAAWESAYQEYPVSLAVGAFAVGIGVGALIGCGLSGGDSRRVEHISARIGRKVLESLSDYLPSLLQR